MRQAHLKAEVRDPYMGNWIPVKIKVVYSEDGEALAIWLINPEGIAIKAEPDEDLYQDPHPDV